MIEMSAENNKPTEFNNGKEKLIYKKIIAAMREIQPIAKDEVNTDGNYKYRSIEAVMGGVSAILKKHGLIYLPTVINREARLLSGVMTRTVVTVRYDIFAEDGSSVSCCVVGEGQDMYDKSSSKAMTAAWKTMLCQVFSIPTANSADDPDAYSPAVPNQRNRYEEKNAAVLTKVTPKNPEPDEKNSEKWQGDDDFFNNVFKLPNDFAPEITLEQAKELKDRLNIAYIDKSTEELNAILRRLSEKLLETPMSEEKRKGLKRKLDGVYLLLEDRKNNH